MDAVTVFHVGKRSASERHEDAIDLVRTLGLTDPTFAKRLTQFGRLLGLKTKAEYADAVVTRHEAEGAVQSAERIVAWARGHLPRT